MLDFVAKKKPAKKVAKTPVKEIMKVNSNLDKFAEWLAKKGKLPKKG